VRAECFEFMYFEFMYTLTNYRSVAIKFDKPPCGVVYNNSSPHRSVNYGNYGNYGNVGNCGNPGNYSSIGLPGATRMLT
jgi:hypothetical protein